MANISSVALWKHPADRTGLIVVACLCAVGLLAFASAESWTAVAVCVVIGGICAIAAAQKKDRYTVRVTAAGGEADALVSEDQGYIQGIVNAVNEAIVRRG